MAALAHPLRLDLLNTHVGWPGNRLAVRPRHRRHAVQLQLPPALPGAVRPEARSPKRKSNATTANGPGAPRSPASRSSPARRPRRWPRSPCSATTGSSASTWAGSTTSIRRGATQQPVHLHPPHDRRRTGRPEPAARRADPPVHRRHAGRERRRRARSTSVSTPSHWRPSGDRAAGRDYRNLLAAGLISGAGDWLLLVALPIFVYQVTGSTLGTAIAFLVELAPPILLGTVAGRLADRWNRRRALIWLSVAQAATLLHSSSRAAGCGSCTG